MLSQSEGMCPCDKINENRTCEQAKFGHMKNNLVEPFNDTTKLRDSMERCTFHYIIIIFELIVLPKNNSAVYQTQVSKPKMVLTTAQMTSVFENADQMGVQHATVVQLALEGIHTVDDLADFDKEALQQLADNLRCPGGRAPNPDPGAAAGLTILTPAFVFGAKSQKCLGIACELVWYYNTVGCNLTAANMQWNNVIKNFEIQWKALKTKRDEDTLEVPKISKSLPNIKWTEAFQDHLHHVIGVRMIPLAYVTRKDEDVPAVAPPLQARQPHSEVHSSIEGEMIARALHTHAMFRDDNAAVYYALEEATRSTSYAASIKPFQRTKKWLWCTAGPHQSICWKGEVGSRNPQTR